MPMVAFCSATCGCRIFATMRSLCPHRECTASATRMCLGVFCAMWRTSIVSSGISGSLVQTRRSPTAWKPLFEVTKRQWDAAIVPNDEFLAPTGHVMEMLSEHQCEGWLEGYLLTGRHGLFNCYEAFIHIVDSMFNQHAKWLKVTSHLPWRRKIASLNYLLASHV